jgi:hypothetical protein
MMNAKVFAMKRRSLMEILVVKTAGESPGISIMIVADPAEIRNAHLPNTNAELYRYTKLIIIA